MSPKVNNCWLKRDSGYIILMRNESYDHPCHLSRSFPWHHMSSSRWLHEIIGVIQWSIIIGSRVVGKRKLGDYRSLLLVIQVSLLDSEGQDNES